MHTIQWRALSTSAALLVFYPLYWLFVNPFMAIGAGIFFISLVIIGMFYSIISILEHRKYTFGIGSLLFFGVYLLII
ncbi:hypothetical protein J4208_05430 [Candidatus Woesearchaeota archaeon]|nr:hypothetical protein [Candidatus Woesearchaeota archaeon]